MPENSLFPLILFVVLYSLPSSEWTISHISSYSANNFDIFTKAMAYVQGQINLVCTMTSINTAMGLYTSITPWRKEAIVFYITIWISVMGDASGCPRVCINMPPTVIWERLALFCRPMFCSQVLWLLAKSCYLFDLLWLSHPWLSHLTLTSIFCIISWKVELSML